MPRNYAANASGYGLVFIKTPGIESNAFVSISDIRGKTLLEFKNGRAATHGINISSLNRGVYVASITTNNKTHHAKFIKR